VSAYLHSATMVKAGVFLLARLYPALGNSEPWFWIVTCTGLATLLVGAYIAIFKHDLKGLLAYSTISHLGLITLLFGLDEPLAIVAGVFHVINHATFKAGLFMSAGIIDHECGTRDMRRLTGLRHAMPFTATLGMTAAAAMAGVPLLNGFLSKEMFFAEALAKDVPGAMQWLLPGVALLAAIFSVAYSLRFVHDVFFGPEPKDLPKTPHEAPFFMRAPVLLLVLLCVVVGLLPAQTAGPILAVAAQAALHGAPGPALPAYELAIWHGVNLPLMMSVAAVAFGIALYFGLQRFIDLHRLVHLPLWFRTGGRDLFLGLMNGGVAAARGVTGALQTGSLQRYLVLLVLMALAAGAWPFLATGPSSGAAPLHLAEVSPAVAGVWLIGIAATIGTVLAWRRRLLALLLMGAAGLVVCLVFVWFSAPDLALTQLSVEVVTIILLLLALNFLPKRTPAESGGMRRLRDAAIALVAGLGTAALAFALMLRDFGLPTISDYHLANSKTGGGGTNVVNVILVDFRGYDTFGEIIVLGIAGLVIFALTEALFAGPAGRRLLGWRADAPKAGDRHPMMLVVATRVLLPISILVGIYIFLRGHNEPGGGFIAGLVVSIALLMQYIASGFAWAEARQRIDYHAFIGAGVVIAGATGIGAWFASRPFLTSDFGYFRIPPFEKFELATAMAFDLGVFLTVIGAVMLTLASLTRIAIRAGGTVNAAPMDTDPSAAPVQEARG